MSEVQQRTLAGEAVLDGIGVHSGEAACARIGPGPPGSGIRFRRTDLDHVVDTELGTTIGKGEARILTVEHLLAGVWAHGVTNAVVELDGPEAPIRDGSFLDYFEAVADAGVEAQDAPARVVEVREPLSLSPDGDGSYVAVPFEGFRLSCTIEYEHPAIGRQYGSFDLDPDGAAFGREIAPARTFGFKEDAEELWARGRARASSVENSVILDESDVLNEELRFPDEFLRHKAGDVLGDLALLGARVAGHVVADRPSHRGNVALGRALAEHAFRGGNEPVIDVQRIMEHLPHRYPMLLVDRIVGYEEGTRIVGVKNVTINEPFFQGHYPGHPIMPGVLIIEAMAQVGGLLLMDLVDDPEDKVVYFMSLDDVKWRRPVTPGDRIVFDVEMLQFRRSVCKMRGTGTVDGKIVAEAELMARIVER